MKNIFVLFYSIICSLDDDEDCSDFNDTDDDETNTKSSRYSLNLKYQYLSMIHGHFHLWHMNIILFVANLIIPKLQNLICRHFISTIFSPLFSPHLLNSLLSTHLSYPTPSINHPIIHSVTHSIIHSINHSVTVTLTGTAHREQRARSQCHCFASSSELHLHQMEFPALEMQVTYCAILYCTVLYYMILCCATVYGMCSTALCFTISGYTLHYNSKQQSAVRQVQSPATAYPSVYVGRYLSL